MPRQCRTGSRNRYVCARRDHSRPVEARSPEHIALGRAIHRLRLDAGVSQDELARRAGMHRTYVGGIERGERNVSFANLLKIADALGERPAKLLAQYEGLRAGLGHRQSDA